MKRWLIAISLLAAGCTNSAPPPTSTPGLATLRVHVIAEPKAGAPKVDSSVKSFDTPTARTNGDFAKVDYADLSQIVVWVEPAGGASQPTPAPQPLHLELRGAAPAASVTAVASIGQQVVLQNMTPMSQTIYSVSDGNDFNLRTLAPAATGQFVVRATGTIEVLADSSEKPLAVIEAAPTPWVKLAHADEVITFVNMHLGQYRIVSWHPRLPGSQTLAQLVADQVVDADIRVGVNALPKVGPTQTP